MPKTMKSDTELAELSEYFGDLYGEIAYDNVQQLRRTLEKMQVNQDPFTYMRTVINVLVDEIGYLKADIGQLRLEMLSRGLDPYAVPLATGAVQLTPLLVELPRSIEIPFGGYLSGYNWHAPEVLPETKFSYRWSGPGCMSTVNLFIDRSVPLVCEIVVGRAFVPEMLVGLQISIDRHDCPSSQVNMPNGQIVISADLPAVSRVPGASVLSLKLNVSPLRPCDVDHHSDDRRALGIMVYKLRIFPRLTASPLARTIPTEALQDFPALGDAEYSAEEIGANNA